jgi:small GTP-binding protein
MGILDRIKDIEIEMARTQKNKATMSHLCRLKAQLAKLRTELLEGQTSSGGKGEGFEVSKTGDARVALIGFPSVGKSTMLSELTGTKSEVAAYEFTTLTCVPGNIIYKGTKVQLLDLPGIIEGAAHGKGRGRQVIAVAQSADLVLMVLDAVKEGFEKNHRQILERELRVCNMRLNESPPDIAFKKKEGGGLKLNSTVKLTHFGDDWKKVVHGILHEYKVHNAEVLFREDATPDQLIDVVEGNRRYVQCLYCYNKIDMCTIEEIDELARRPNSVVCSVTAKLNLGRLVDTIWGYLGLVRIYTKRRGAAPDLADPVVLTKGRHGCTVKAACVQVHKEMLDNFNFALVWGTSAKHHPKPQRVGLAHMLQDEDVMQVVSKTNQQQRQDKDYGAKVQAYYDEWHRKKKKGKLKT